MPNPPMDAEYLLSVVIQLHREVAMQITASKAKDGRIAELEAAAAKMKPKK